MTTDTRAALIAAVAALLGACVGGGATYIASHSVQSRQLKHEEALQRKEAQGDARVFVEQTLNAQEFVLISLGDQELPGTEALKFFRQPTTEERQRIYEQLDPQQTRELVLTIQSLKFLENMISREPGARMTPNTRNALQSYFDQFQRAEDALAPFTGIPAPTGRPAQGASG